MNVKMIAGLVGVLSMVTFSANANWTCNVANKRGEHWTFTAPTEENANRMAVTACDNNSFNKANCNPVCTDNGVTNGRWHCVVSNERNQHWSFFSPSQSEAFNMAKQSCDANSINPANCNPNCLPE